MLFYSHAEKIAEAVVMFRLIYLRFYFYISINPFDYKIVSFSDAQQCIIVLQYMHAGRYNFANISTSILIYIKSTFRNQSSSFAYKIGVHCEFG